MLRTVGWVGSDRSTNSTWPEPQLATAIDAQWGRRRRDKAIGLGAERYRRLELRLRGGRRRGCYHARTARRRDRIGGGDPGRIAQGTSGHDVGARPVRSCRQLPRGNASSCDIGGAVTRENWSDGHSWKPIQDLRSTRSNGEGQVVVHRGRSPILLGYLQLKNWLAKIAISCDN